MCEHYIHTGSDAKFQDTVKTVFSHMLFWKQKCARTPKVPRYREQDAKGNKGVENGEGVFLTPLLASSIDYDPCSMLNLRV